MRTPIAHTLAWPERFDAGVRPLDLAAVSTLSFEHPDTERFPSLDLAFEAMKVGASAPITLNAANEIAVEAFLNREIPFDRIAAVVSHVLDDIPVQEINTIEDIMGQDTRARTIARHQCEREKALQ